MILKHLKRSMISPLGGLQVISDINAYHSFIVSLRQATIIPYFTALKMICNLYIVDAPKDLAGLVKDVQRYEGTMRSEEYVELVQSNKAILMSVFQCLRTATASHRLAPERKAGRSSAMFVSSLCS